MLYLMDYTLAMKSHSYTQFILALSLLTFSITSAAQQWYHVELIVFEQLSTITDEQWPEMTDIQPVELSPEMATEMIQPAENETLLNSADRLNRSSLYHVRYHRSWQQPILKKFNAKSVDVHSEDNKVEGTIKLYKSTYLHASLDLWLKENDISITSWSDVSPNGESIDLPRNPNLKESRRIRSKKMYFFDHPKLGALLQLTPIDTPIALQAAEELESFSLPTEATATSSE